MEDRSRSTWETGCAAADGLDCHEQLSDSGDAPGGGGDSRWWLPALHVRMQACADGELLGAMLHSLEEREGSVRVPAAPRLHLGFRRLLVEWIRDLCFDCRQGLTTCWLAAAYMARARASRPQRCLWPACCAIAQ